MSSAAPLRGRWLRWLDRRIPPASEVRLNNRRIFILPSRAGVVFLAALLVMLLAAINYQNSLAYGLTFLLGSLMLVGILHTYRNLSGLRLQAGGAAPVFLGEPAQLRVRLDGPRAHHAIALGWPPQPLTLFEVPTGTVCEALLTLPTEHRGWLRPGRLKVQSSFPLGLLTAWSWVDLQLAVLVYPRPEPGDLTLTRDGEGDPQDSLPSRERGVDDFEGLRPYQRGDSRRRLSWKAYSRGQGLLVKSFTAASGSDLCLDFSLLGGSVEQRLSLLCHWVLELTRRDQPFALRLPGCHLPADRGETHRDACLRELALFGVER